MKLRNKHDRIKDLPLSTRPREKLKAMGVGNLASAELLAIILGTGTKKLNVLKLSQKVLDQYKDNQLSHTTLSQLLKIDGIGPTKATRILAMIEFGNRLFAKPTLGKIKIQTNEDVISQVREYSSKKQEHIIVLYLNARHELIQKEVIAIGKLNSALIEPKEVLSPALVSPCASFILIHNHPSGDPNPSEDDIDFTKRLQKASEIVGIQMLDHLIICPNDYFSFREA